MTGVPGVGRASCAHTPDVAAAARIVGALADALIDATTFPYDAVGGVDWIAQSVAEEPDTDDAKRVAAALLDACRREVAPTLRVFLPGDRVPAGITVAGAWPGHTGVPSGAGFVAESPLVEVRLPTDAEFDEAVAGEQGRRTGEDDTLLAERARRDTGEAR